MFADVSATTVLLIAAPVAVFLFLLVLVLYASARSKPSVATRLEREASRREKARRRVLAESEREEEAVPVMAAEPAADRPEATAGTSLAVAEPAVLEAGPSPEVRAQLEEAQRARLVAPPVPARDPEKAELDRRQFINRGLAGGTALGFGIFGVASIAFLYPKLGRGFGGKVSGGRAEAAIQEYQDKKTPLYIPEGRFYLVPFIVGPGKEEEAKKAYSQTYEMSKAAGVTAVYQKCAHLGCRVPWCAPSQWFECPCHGSQYNALGERQGGPAPRGLSRFPFEIQGGEVVVDTSRPVDAPPQGTETTGLPPPPVHCVGAV